MRITTAAGIAFSFVCVSAADAPSDYQTYGGVPVNSEPSLTSAFNAAKISCEPETSLYRRGSYPVGMGPILAMRSCLARRNFIDGGTHSHLLTSLALEHFFDR